MIRIATVFSGIGAIEHALDRMVLEHEIVFACDNGDVDILSKPIEANLKSIYTNIEELNTIISEIKIDPNNSRDIHDLKDYKEQLDSLVHMYEALLPLVDSSFISNYAPVVLQVANFITSDSQVKKSKVAEYKKTLLEYDSSSVDAKYFILASLIVSIVRDFHKNNDFSLLYSCGSLENLESKDNINWNAILPKIRKIYEIQEEYKIKKQIKLVKELSERLSMLHERINSFHILKKLDTFDSYEDKKAYVDQLYAPYEKQNKVKQSYLANYKLNPTQFHWNVSFLDGKQYKNKVDLFVGGSPCQSFSLVGKQRGLEDTRGTLFYEYARLVSEIQPKVFMYENVKAVLSNDKGRTWETMQNVFTSLNYVWKHQVLNSKDYGVPQNRERVFVVGVRRDLAGDNKFEFPKAFPLEKTMKDLLLDNVSRQYYLPPKGVDFVISGKNLSKKFTQVDGDIALCQKKNQQFNWHGDFVFVETNKDVENTKKELEKYYLSDKVKKYVLSSGTKSFYVKPKTDLEIARPLLTTMHKMHRAGVDNYVTSYGNLRKLTPRECLRLMGFCDSFKIVVSDTSMYQQAGNSIVVDVLINIMTAIMNCFPNVF